MECQITVCLFCGMLNRSSKNKIDKNTVIIKSLTQLPNHLLITKFIYSISSLLSPLLYSFFEIHKHMSIRTPISIRTIHNSFFKYRQDCSEDINDVFAKIFSDKHRTPLKHIALRNCTITDEGMSILLQHDLVSLSLWYCDMVTTASWPALVEHGAHLEFLELGRYVDMLKYSEPNEKTPIDFKLELPNIRTLILTGVVLQPTVEFAHLKNLSHLDLTQCTFHNEFTLEAIANLPNLTTLILFNVWPLESELPTICRMKTLRKLDISTGYFNTNNYGTFKNPNEVCAYYIWLESGERPVFCCCWCCFYSSVVCRFSCTHLCSFVEILIDIGVHCREPTAFDASRYIWYKFGWQWCGAV